MRIGIPGAELWFRIFKCALTTSVDLIAPYIHRNSRATLVL
jgi:hypothetical protein